VELSHIEAVSNLANSKIRQPDKSIGANMPSSIKIGSSNYISHDLKVHGKYVNLLGELYYCIENYDQMPPFFMSIVSDTDHWMFNSSTGGLTAGRMRADLSLFPYETDDKVTESYQKTGPLTALLVTRDENTSLWEPFSDRYQGLYAIECKIYKNISGNKLIFEETNHSLGLTCRQAWRTSDRFGFILTTWLHNLTDDPVQIRLLSGVQNILPFGANTQLQSNYSNLLNAYKRNELESSGGLGIFSLSSTLTDLAEPSESLKASTAWQIGLDHPDYLLSSLQVDDFRRSGEVTNETDVRGYRGAYLLRTSITLTGNDKT